MPTILFVSGATDVVQSACQHLAAKGYDVVAAASATEALRTFHTLVVDAVVFDTAVRDMSAQDFCRWLQRDPQRRDVPTVFLGPPAVRWLPDSVPMRIGRDALVSKPFACWEIDQALKELLGPGSSAAAVPKALAVGSLSLDRGLFALAGEAGTVTLTPTEFRLLEYLMQRPGMVITGEELLEKVWGFFPHTGSGDIVRSHMRNLRAKIRQVNPGREVIRTLPRRGYRLTA